MNKFQNLKKKFLPLALDEYIDFYTVIFSLRTRFDIDYKQEESFKNETLRFIRYLLETNLFTIEECNINEISFKESDSIDDILSKIDYLWTNSKEDNWQWIVSFILTTQGITKAKEDLIESIKIDEQVLIQAHKKNQNLKEIFDTVKKCLRNDNFDEIIYETLKSIRFLLDNKFIEVGDEKPCFVKWNLNFPDTISRLESELKTFKDESEYEVKTFIQNTPPTEALIEKWKECGGRLVKKWYYYIDNR